MNQKKAYLLLELADDNDGYVSVEDAKLHGIEQTYLVEEEKQGLFKKVAKGLYLRTGYEEDRYYITHFIYKKAVYARRSCAILHGLIEEDGKVPMINLPANYMTGGIDGASCRHVGKKELETGVSLVVSPSGNLVLGYDIERVFIDALRYPSDYSQKELESLIKKALNQGLDQSKTDAYASLFGVGPVLRFALAIFQKESRP